MDGNQETLKEDGLVLLALVGMKYPCHPKMKEAVKECQNAGVDVKMITGDDVSIAKDIARECGILMDTDEDGAVITGEEFRGYSPNKIIDEVDKIQVMACSSLDDKLLMVKTLKKRDHIVAVSGYSRNDVLALLEAHIGISMGILGTDEVGKENFGMFELTLNLAALVVFFLSAVSAGEVPLNSTLVLWLNLIINTLASMALATEKPSHGTPKKSIQRQHVDKEEPLMSHVMWRNLLGQVMYQIVVVLTLLFKAKSILGFEAKMANLTDAEEIKEMKAYFIKERNTLLFNAFLLC
ncbi:calcium-transporting ATPase 12, plasma membrane-type-like [Ziziphus jujuba]|uniref:Calcium-transporting ATPase 12, plasma membrane-type-like n=1 Tax=Ziziphus jujuba TaxID=326968 RepID=A0A6P4A3B2_ZIZJJ|nr:calcium-transporting ATPase 12, plasma membrane-type-like [Ziziphus jujuba]